MLGRIARFIRGLIVKPERIDNMQPHIQEYQWIIKRKWTPKAMKELKRRKQRALERMYG